jgi:hypothetical protein
MEWDFVEEVEQLDRVPEPFRPLYAEGEGGKFRLGDSYKGVATAVVGLNTALKAARKEAKARNVDLTPLSEFGATPEEIKTKVTARLTELQTQLAEGGKVNVEKIKKEFAEANGVELKKLNTRNEALQGQLYKLLVENEATSAVLGAKGIPELVLPFVKNQVKVVEENGAMSVYVVDAAGDRRYSGVTGQPMTLVELVGELKTNPKYGRLFEADTNSGGGLDPVSGKRPPAPPKTEMSSLDKISAGLRKGVARGK